ncbi:ankyrin repeat-containing domain protein [Ephemerocybe angulata]|uniref:Ankyrin repeat-containing domain protein n=1 Tax=Ephemerocybe angulata TaxID=980116 RepID=A0A8H6HE39_9AGAR|nr:ankyrin repeat-containing domain protein [Tulosesus angulatus]
MAERLSEPHPYDHLWSGPVLLAIGTACLYHSVLPSPHARDFSDGGVGMPGSGKTILSSFSLKYLKEKFAGTQYVAVVGAFLRYTEDRSTRDILAGLIRQLVERHEQAYNYMKTIYFTAQNEVLSEAELVEVFQGAVGLFSKVFIVIDGLDEANDIVKDGLLRVLPSLGANALITSRPLDLFKHHIPDALHILIEARTGDIDIFVQETIKTNSRLGAIIRGDPSLVELLKSRIKESSKGMFLVARLQMEVILQDPRCVNGLLKALNKLPSGVDDMYRHSLQRVNAQAADDVSIAHRVFLWLLHAREPPSAEELQHALATSFTTLTYDAGDLVPIPTILSTCGGLVTVELRKREGLHRRGSYYNEIRFIHYTAHKYIEGLVFPNLPPPQTFMAVTCLAYLARHDGILQRWRWDGDSKFLASYISSQALLDYADWNWGIHAHLSQREGALHPCIPDYLARYASLKLINHRFHKGEPQDRLPTILHLAAMYGLIDIIVSNPFPLPIARGDTPFHYAAKWGQVEALKALCALHAGVNAQNDEGMTPLMAACQEGQTEIVRLLLSQLIVKLNVRDDSGRTAFWHACVSRNNDIPMLFVSWNPNLEVAISDEEGDTAFMMACRGGLVEMVTWFLSQASSEVFLCQTNVYGETALLQLCRYEGDPNPSHQDRLKIIVDLLLRYRCDPQIQDTRYGRSPFLWAAARGSQDSFYFMKRLLDALPAIDIAQRDRRGRNALMLSLVDPLTRRRTVEFLLSLPAIDINAQDEDGRTSLMYACAYANREAVSILLSNSSINLRLVDKQGHSALYWGCASISECAVTENLQMLFEYDWEPSLVRKTVLTSVENASKERHEWAEDDFREYRRLGFTMDDSEWWDARSAVLEQLIWKEISPETFHAFTWTLDNVDTVLLLAHARGLRCRSAVRRILKNCGAFGTSSSH